MAKHQITEAEIAFSANDSKLRATYDSIKARNKELKGDLTGLGSSIDRLLGTRLQQDANKLATSIRLIGGASKLTDAEVKSSLATFDAWIAKAQRVGQSVSPHVLQTRDALAKMNTEGAKTPSIFDTISAKSVALGSAIGSFVGNIAWSAVNKLGAELMEFVDLGAKLPAVQSSFQRLSSGIGQNSDDMLASMQRGTQGLVRNFDLMQQANKAMLLGLPVTTESMGVMAEAATKLGRAMGQDATKSLDDLITALGRSSPMILDNLGLTVKVGEANEAYAAKLGKTADQLTDAEKKLAFYEAAMEAALKKTEELGDQTQTLGEIAESVWVKVGNVVTESAAIINTQVGKILTSKDELVNFLALLAMSGSPGRALQAMAAADRAKAAAAAPGKDINLQSELSPEEELRRILAAAKALTDQGLKPLTKAQREAASALLATGKSAKEVVEEMSRYRSLTGVTEAQIERLAEKQKAAAKEGENFAAITKKIRDAQIPLTEAQKHSVRQLMELGLGHGEIARHLRVSEIQVKNYADQQKILNGIISQQIALLPRLKTNFAELNFGMGITPQLAMVGRTSLGSDLAGRLNGIFSTIDLGSVGARAAISDVKRGLTDGVQADKSFWTDVFGGSEAFGNQLASSILAAIQGGGGILRAAGGTIGSTLMSGLAKHLTTAKEGGVAAITGWLGGVVSAVLPVVGSLLGPLASKIGSFFASIFDRNKGRDLVENFAESMGGFDALHKQLQGLGDEGERLWIQLTQGVGRNNPQQAQAAIDAINQALGRAEQRTEAFNTSIGGLLRQIQSLGTGLPASLRGYLDELQRAGQLTQDNIDLLAQLAGEGEVDWRKVQEAVQRYGGDIEKLGGSFQNARLKDAWQTVIDDIELFQQAGVNANDILDLIDDKISELVQQSQRFGTEIPENMRPFIRSLIESGKLLDENGNAITDINKLTFGETLQSSLQKLTREIQRLINQLRGVPDAIEDIPKNIDIDVNYHENGRPDPIRADRSGMARDEALDYIQNRPAPELTVFPQAEGGDWLVRKPTLFLAGEAGPERATFTPLSSITKNGAGFTGAEEVMSAINAGRLPDYQPGRLMERALAGLSSARSAAVGMGNAALDGMRQAAGAGGLSIGDINVSLSGAEGKDPKQIAREIAEQIAIEVPKKIEEGGMIRTLWQRQVGAMVGAR